MSKLLPLFVLLLLTFSCKDAVTDTALVQGSGWAIEPADFPKKNVVNTKAQFILKDWKAYADFEASFDKIYTLEFREDFVLLIDELVEKQKALEISNYPTAFDIPQVKGRQKVLKTFILKIKGDLEYRQNPETSTKEMISAFNALRSQFNVIVNNTLPKELLSNENL